MLFSSSVIGVLVLTGIPSFFAYLLPNDRSSFSLKSSNQQAATEIKTVYGAVTTGSIWQFLKLEEQILTIDLSEYYLKDVNKILGILASGIFQ